MRVKKEFLEEQMLRTLDAYEGKESLISCQGQAMDGYSALENFLWIARELRKRRKEGPTLTRKQFAKGMLSI